MVFQTEQEKKEFLEQVNFYKENLMKGNKNLSEEEAVLKARQAISSLNITYILADVCNSFLMETEAVLKEIGMALSGEDKHRFLLFQKSVHSARCNAGAFARPPLLHEGFRRCGKLFGLVFEFPQIGGDQDDQCTEDEDAAGVLVDHAQREWRV